MLRLPRGRDRVIYVIAPQDSFVVKIGHTSNKPSLRLGNLQIGNPELLVVRWAGPGDEALEKHLHAVFKDYRIRGEWFDLSTLGDPVQAVKDEIRKASERQTRGEDLLAAQRFRGRISQDTGKAFDEVPDEDVDTERPPWVRRSRAVYMPMQTQLRSLDERFPPIPWRSANTEEAIGSRWTAGEEAKPGCIRVWKGRCRRPSGTTCEGC